MAEIRIFAARKLTEVGGLVEYLCPDTEAELFLKQFRMRSYTDQSYLEILLIKPDENEIVLNVTFKISGIVSLERMRVIL